MFMTQTGVVASEMPRKRVAADPNGDYSLAEKNGPWLIMAMSFNGEGGETEARELVTELRSGDGRTFKEQLKGITKAGKRNLYLIEEPTIGP